MSAVLPPACAACDEHLVSLAFDDVESVPAECAEHAATCPRCSAELATLRGTRSLAALPLEEPSERVDRHILEALDAHLAAAPVVPPAASAPAAAARRRESSTRARPARRRWMAPLAAAAGLGVVIGGTLLMSDGAKHARDGVSAEPLAAMTKEAQTPKPVAEKPAPAPAVQLEAQKSAPPAELRAEKKRKQAPIDALGDGEAFLDTAAPRGAGRGLGAPTALGTLGALGGGAKRELAADDTRSMNTRVAAPVPRKSKSVAKAAPALPSAGLVVEGDAVAFEQEAPAPAPAPRAVDLYETADKAERSPRRARVQILSVESEEAQRSPTVHERNLELARDAARRGEHARAVELYARVTGAADAPESVLESALTGQARSLLALRRFEEAAAIAHRLAVLSPEGTRLGVDIERARLEADAPATTASEPR